MGSLASMTACGGSHPTPQSQKPVGSATPSTSAVATTPEPPKARWVETGSYNAVGPATSQGTLVLLGGRRAVVAPDGSLRTASGATPEPIVEYLEVPTASGARLVGRGEQGLYRFDDPLETWIAFDRSSPASSYEAGHPGNDTWSMRVAASIAL